MARYTGPRLKLARREGTDLMLTSGVRPLILSARRKPLPDNTAPGVSVRRTTPCSFAKSRRCAVSTACSSVSFAITTSVLIGKKGATGENLLRALESRLDNVVYRLGLGSTRAEARQLVSHKSIEVNGALVNIPSYQVKPDDVITVREKSKSQLRIQAALQLAAQRAPCEWLEFDASKLAGTFKRHPDRGELSAEINENLIVELYSK